MSRWFSLDGAAQDQMADHVYKLLDKAAAQRALAAQPVAAAEYAAAEVCATRQGLQYAHQILAHQNSEAWWDGCKGPGAARGKQPVERQVGSAAAGVRGVSTAAEESQAELFNPNLPDGDENDRDLRRVTIWNSKEGKKRSGNSAPFQKNLDEYLRNHPGWCLYDGQDQRLAKKKRAEKAEKQRAAKKRQNAAPSAPMASHPQQQRLYDETDPIQLQNILFLLNEPDSIDVQARAPKRPKPAPLPEVGVRCPGCGFGVDDFPSTGPSGEPSFAGTLSRCV